MAKFQDFDDIELEKHLLSCINQTRSIEAEILLILSEAKGRNLTQRQGFTGLASFCENRLGLSKDQSWRRSQATAVIDIAPEALTLLRNGKTHISHLAMLAPKITVKNKKVILDFLPSASKTDLTFFLQTIDKDGNKADG